MVGAHTMLLMAGKRVCTCTAKATSWSPTVPHGTNLVAPAQQPAAAHTLSSLAVRGMRTPLNVAARAACRKQRLGANCCAASTAHVAMQQHDMSSKLLVISSCHIQPHVVVGTLHRQQAMACTAGVEGPDRVGLETGAALKAMTRSIHLGLGLTQTLLPGAAPWTPLCTSTSQLAQNTVEQPAIGVDVPQRCRLLNMPSTHHSASPSL